jgi:hypothetical protein
LHIEQHVKEDSGNTSNSQDKGDTLHERCATSFLSAFSYRLSALRCLLWGALG